MATGFTTVTDEHLRRANVWSRDLKSLLLDELMGMRFVRLLTDFPDGTTFDFGRLVKDQENFTICWNTPKPFVLLSENQKGKDSTESGQSAGKKFNANYRFSLASGDLGWRRFHLTIPRYREERIEEDQTSLCCG